MKLALIERESIIHSDGTSRCTVSYHSLPIKGTLKW